MGLDEFLDNQLDDEQKQSSGARTYTRFNQEEFEDLLYDLPGRFYLVSTEEDPNLKFTRELVYSTDELGHDDLIIRVYSTIDERTGKARDKGDDAIRTVIWSDSLGSHITGKKKTLRIETWKKNLADKIFELLDDWQSLVLKCEDCGSWMEKRDGPYGEFMGCTDYPDCQTTVDIDEAREDYGMLI